MSTASIGRSALAACALASAALGVHAAAPRYTAVDLSSLQSRQVLGADFINEAGEIAGHRIAQAMFYTPGGAFQFVNDLAGMTGVTSVNDLSDAGHLAGRNNGTAFIYTPGEGVQYLPGRSVTGINSSGQYVGQLQEGTFGGYRYAPGQGESSVPGEPVRINESGDVLFRGDRNGGIQRSDGSIVDIGTPGGAFLSDLNDRGDVVGMARTAGGLAHAHLFTAEGEVIDLDTFGRTAEVAYSIARAVNNHRQVVGGYGDGVSFNGFLAGRSGMYDIESLLDPLSASQWDITEAMDINDAGQIIGMGRFNGRMTAFLLNPLAAPVPEPAAWLLLLAGVPVLAWSSRRQGRTPAGQCTA